MTSLSSLTKQKCQKNPKKKMNTTVQNTDKNDLSYATFKYKKELRFFR